MHAMQPYARLFFFFFLFFFLWSEYEFYIFVFRMLYTFFLFLFSLEKSNAWLVYYFAQDLCPSASKCNVQLSNFWVFCFVLFVCLLFMICKNA